MNRVQVLSAILGLLLLLAGGLYYKGYWDGWTDRKGDIKQALVDDFMRQGAPEKESGIVAECLSDKVVEIMTELQCPLSMDTEASIKECLQANPIGQFTLSVSLLGCVQELSKELGSKDDGATQEAVPQGI